MEQFVDYFPKCGEDVADTAMVVGGRVIDVDRVIAAMITKSVADDLFAFKELLVLTGAYEEAICVSRALLPLLQREFGADHNRTLAEMKDLGGMLWRLGSFSAGGAMQEKRRVLALIKSAAATNSPPAGTDWFLKTVFLFKSVTNCDI
jgi:hypothetical protein